MNCEQQQAEQNTGKSEGGVCYLCKKFSTWEEGLIYIGDKDAQFICEPCSDKQMEDPETIVVG